MAQSLTLILFSLTAALMTSDIASKEVMRPSRTKPSGISHSTAWVTCCPSNTASFACSLPMSMPTHCFAISVLA